MRSFTHGDSDIDIGGQLQTALALSCKSFVYDACVALPRLCRMNMSKPIGRYKMRFLLADRGTSCGQHARRIGMA